MPSIIDLLIGKRSLEEQRDEAKQAARERFDPGMFAPTISQARKRATQGISEQAEESTRRQALSDLLRQPDTERFGGSQARAIAGNERRNQQVSSSLANLARQMTQRDEEVKRRAEGRLAQAKQKARQTAAEREAKVHEIESQFEAEMSRRKQGLQSTAISAAGTLLTTPFGAGSSLAARGLNAIFGTDRDKQPALQSATQAAAEAARPQPQQGQDQIIKEDININASRGAEGLGERLSVPEADNNLEGQAANPEPVDVTDITGGGPFSIQSLLNQETQDRQTQQDQRSPFLPDVPARLQTIPGQEETTDPLMELIRGAGEVGSALGEVGTLLFENR